MVTPYASKQGRYGTLYLYGVDYNDVPGPDGCHVGRWRTWAYSAVHAWENWHDSNDDLGFAAVGDFTREKARMAA